MFRVFGGERIRSLMSAFQLDDLPMESKMLVRMRPLAESDRPACLCTLSGSSEACCPMAAAWSGLAAMRVGRQAAVRVAASELPLVPDACPAACRPTP